MATLLLAGAVCAVYCRALDAPFVFDDSGSVIHNRSIVRLWPLWGDAEHPGPLNPPSDLPTSGRQLVNLSLAINYAVGQLNPVGYHAFNLIVHLLSAALLMGIVRRTLCLDYFAGRFTNAAGPLAFAAALLWAVHPLQTETVIYVTQRTELMVGFFYLATLYACLRYWTAATPAAGDNWLALATLASVAGMACKEVMVTAPVIVLLYQRTFIAGSFRRALRQSWPLYVGLLRQLGLSAMAELFCPAIQVGRISCGDSRLRVVVYSGQDSVDVFEADDLALAASDLLLPSVLDHVRRRVAMAIGDGGAGNRHAGYVLAP